MNHLNYKHLKYFWMVAKLGSIVKASEQLNLTPQSISGQISDLEKNLEQKLFKKVGRNLVLTEIGEHVLDYADKIFLLGSELVDSTQNEHYRKSFSFRIGITDSVPKAFSYQVLKPVMDLEKDIRLTCTEGKLSSLLSSMSVNNLDLIIADQPMSKNLNLRAYNHFLGDSLIAIYGCKKLIAQFNNNSFPLLLNHAPFLMQRDNVTFKPDLIAWFNEYNITPFIVGEFDDSALLKLFGQSGVGFFAAPAAIANYLRQQYQVEQIGIVDGVTASFYAITTQRRMTHPAAIAINSIATKEIFR